MKAALLRAGLVAGLLVGSLAGLLVGAAACGGKSSHKLEGRYDLGAPGAGWSSVRPGGADQAWVNQTLGGTIYADSNCAERYDDSPLAKLLDSLTLGIATGDPIRQEPRTMDGRDALMRVSQGALDGVPVMVGAVVSKKDNCVYDVIYVAPPASFDRGWDAFEAVTGRFQTRGAP